MISLKFICKRTYYNIVSKWPTGELQGIYTEEDLREEDIPNYSGHTKDLVCYTNSPHQIEFWIKALTETVAKVKALKYLEDIKKNPTKYNMLFQQKGTWIELNYFNNE